MRLKNFLIVVSDIERSKSFYKELFGLEVVADFGKNVILTEKLVLQEKDLWETSLNKQAVTGTHNAELYFEENNLVAFVEKLNSCSWDIQYVHEPLEHDWGQHVIRIYDPDLHVIEVGESLECVARRLLREGMKPEETARKTQLPLEHVLLMIPDETID